MSERKDGWFFSLRTKFIILFCLLITIPFLVSGIVTYVKYSADVQSNAESYTMQIMNQIQINLDRYIKEMERLTLSPLYDENVLKILQNHNGEHQTERYLTTDETLKMHLFISSLAFDRTEIDGVFLFANDGSLFSNLDSTGKHWRIEASDWMAPVREADGGLAIIPPHEASSYRSAPYKVVSIARVIREPYTDKYLGIVKVDLTPEGFRKILNPVTLSEHSRLFVTDQEDQVIYSTWEGAPPAAIVHEIEADNHVFLRAEAVSRYTGLKAIGLIPLGDLRKEAQELTSFTLIISLISLTFAYILAVVTSNRLVKPIRHLQSKMKLVQKGSLKERASVTTRDEIGQLTAVFNGMIEEINYLVKEVYETQLREREAELSALQSQINPHFMYNTLETMNMLALQQHHFELSSMITSLGKLLRYTVDKQEKPVYLRDEIRFIESYLQIQSFRLGSRFQTEIHIDPSFEDCLVPKLVLQPLIENVIEHGLKNVPQVAMSLSARADNDDLVLIVTDNGAGMSLRELNELERQINMPRHEELTDEAGGRGFGEVRKGYALRNVHQRIRLLHGKPYGLELNKSARQGTQIMLRLPLQWEA